MNKEQFEQLSKELDRVQKQIDQVFEKMGVELDAAIEKAQVSYNMSAPWEPHISWIPRKIGKKWYWHTPIYRKRVLSSDGNYWIYGTEFDMLRDIK